MERTGLGRTGFYRRTISKKNPIVFKEFDLQFIKELKTDKFDKDIAYTISKGRTKVKLIPLLFNDLEEQLRGRPKIDE